MAFSFQKTYRPDIEQLLRQYYQSLSEKDRRRLAALEAIKLGHGGIRYIAKVLACDPQTIKDGMRGSLRVFHPLRPTYLSRRLGFRRLNCPNPWRRFADTTYFQARLAFTVAAFNVLVQWHGFLHNASGFVPPLDS
jgi:hypothetical protein